MTKRAPIGLVGVRPAALLLDPIADLNLDQTPADGDPTNDEEDILYIAGGKCLLVSDGPAGYRVYEEED